MSNCDISSRNYAYSSLRFRPHTFNTLHFISVRFKFFFVSEVFPGLAYPLLSVRFFPPGWLAFVSGAHGRKLVWLLTGGVSSACDTEVVVCLLWLHSLYSRDCVIVFIVALHEDDVLTRGLLMICLHSGNISQTTFPYMSSFAGNWILTFVEGFLVFICLYCSQSSLQAVLILGGKSRFTMNDVLANLCVALIMTSVDA